MGAKYHLWMIVLEKLSTQVYVEFRLTQLAHAHSETRIEKGEESRCKGVSPCTDDQLLRVAKVSNCCKGLIQFCTSCIIDALTLVE